MLLPCLHKYTVFESRYPMKKPRQTYEARADLIAAACNIGYEILAKADIPDEEKQRELRIILSDKHSAFIRLLNSKGLIA